MKSNAEIVEGAMAAGVIDRALRMYRVPPTYYDDLRQEVAMILLSMDNERLNDISGDGRLPHFITKIAKNQYNSTTSDFFRRYRRHEKTTFMPNSWDIVDED